MFDEFSNKYSPLWKRVCIFFLSLLAQMLFIVPTCPSVPVFSFFVSVIISMLTFFGGWKLKNWSKQLRNGNVSMPETISILIFLVLAAGVWMSAWLCVCVQNPLRMLYSGSGMDQLGSQYFRFTKWNNREHFIHMFNHFFTQFGWPNYIHFPSKSYSITTVALNPYN